MLLHNYLQRKSDILTKAMAEVRNLLTEITDPKMKELVDEWEPGDPITDNYPQVDQKADKPAAEDVAGAHEQDGLPGNIPGASKAAEATGQLPQDTGQKEAAAVAQTNHQPEGQTQQEPAGGTAPA